MASTYGRKFKVTLSGTSHGPCIRVAIDGIPEGTVIDYKELSEFQERRMSRGVMFDTSRHEPDDVIWESGIVNFGGSLGIVTDSKVVARIDNKDVDSSDYEEYRDIPRPGHADYAAIMKDGEAAEIAGGGRFSGRLTAGLCIAGGIAKQILKKMDIEILSDIVEIGGDSNPIDFEDVIGAAHGLGDSVGGIIECAVMGLKPGSCGDANFDGLESRISEAVFGIPAVKGIEFGAGFKASRMLGSANNDAFYFDEDGNVKTRTNNAGGILGGIANGMPVVFRAAFKPVPSISVEQESVNLKTGESVKISVKGRHDSCIVPRALPCVESAAAIAILDALLEAGQDDKEPKKHGETISELRDEIDDINKQLVDLISKRMDVSKKIGIIKSGKGLPVFDAEREKQVLENIVKLSPEEYAGEMENIFKTVMESSRNVQSAPKKKFGLLGKTLGHSYSPEIHQMISEMTGKDYEYVLFEKPEEELEDFIRNGDWQGLNVTIPYKEKVIKYIDGISDEAAAIGAVNTIVKKDGETIGFNTDYFGFMDTVLGEVEPDYDFTDKKCLILGAGGAAKAVKQVFYDLGADDIVMLSHKDINDGKINENKDAAILVNATPVGMYPENGKTLCYPGSFPKLEYVFDIVYNPLRTNLVCQAQKSLIEAKPGLHMLVSQAVYSSMLFNDYVFAGKDRIINEILERITEDKRNIVLIGMPGVGKTTYGRKLAEKTGKEFFDTDQMIYERTGRQPGEIIDQDGEEEFRDIESMMIHELSSMTGIIIATGGGVVTREENYYALAENGKFVFLKRDDIEELETEGRPLSRKIGLDILYKMRKPLYESWADETVTVE